MEIIKNTSAGIFILLLVMSVKVFPQKQPPVWIAFDSKWRDSVGVLVPKGFLQIPSSAIIGGTGGGDAILDSIQAHEIGTNPIVGKVAFWASADSLGSVYNLDTAGGGAMTKQAIMDTLSHTYVRNNVSKYVEMFDDFAGGIIATNQVSYLLQGIVSGTGAGVNKSDANPDSTAFGTATLTTGTTNTGYAVMSGTVDGVILGNGETYFETRVYIPDISTYGGAGESFVVDIGFLDNQAAAEPTDGVYFRYDSTHTDWRLMCEANTTIDTTNVSGITVAADTWYKLGISVNAYTATFYINN